MPTSLRCVRTRAGVVALLATGALLAMGVPQADAQVPPPPPPGTLPPTPVAPPTLPAEPPLPGDEVPPPASPHTLASPTGSQEPPQPGPVPNPPAPKPPRKLVELAQASSALDGRRLLVPVRCRESGSAVLRHGKRMIARASFRCRNYVALVTFKLPRREAKALRRAGRAKLAVRVKAGGKSATLRMTVTGKKGAARAGSSGLRAASATPPWRQGSDMYCGSASGYPRGLNLSPGYQTAYDGRDDLVTYIYSFYIWGNDSRYPLWSNWAAPGLAPGVGAIWNIGHDSFGVRSGWVAVAVWKYWYRANRYDSFWLVPRTDAFGNPVSGYYCLWGA
jgi:hypothetical protein